VEVVIGVCREGRERKSRHIPRIHHIAETDEAIKYSGSRFDGTGRRVCFHFFVPFHECLL